MWPSKTCCLAWSNLTMASAAGPKYKQDMPPKGGYGPVDYSRKIFKRIKGKLGFSTVASGKGHCRALYSEVR